MELKFMENNKLITPENKSLFVIEDYLVNLPAIWNNWIVDINRVLYAQFWETYCAIMLESQNLFTAYISIKLVQNAW